MADAAGIFLSVLKRIVLVFILLIFIQPIFGQKRTKKSNLDSLHVKGKSYLVLQDTSIYVKKDTIFYLPDSVVAKLRKDREGRSSEFYQRLKEKLSKRKVTKEIYELLFRDVAKPVAPLQTQTSPTDNFERYEGKTINTIHIKRLNPFGTLVTDTSKQSNDWFSKAGNNTHIKTKEWVIKNNLVIKEGDEIKPEVLRDAERILRRLPFLRDARVFIIPKKRSKDVDILVITRDVWNITGSASYSDPENFEFTITDKNFLGLGYELENAFPYSIEGNPNFGYLGTYRANNIKSTFITGELTLGRSYLFDRRGIEFYRNFITPETQYAGGVEIAQERLTNARIYEDTTIFFDTRKSFQDYWLGRSFLIYEDEDGGRTNFQIAVSYANNDFIEKPVISRDTNQVFFDNYLRLLSVGIAKTKFDRSSLILGFGRTEDIPLGYLGEITIGRENNQFTARTYFGSRISYGQYFDRLGYIRPAISIGSFFEDKAFEQGVVKLNLSYFSFLYRVRRFNFRQFASINYTYGINRFANEFIDINNANGIRGLDYTFLRGTKKLTINFETVAFTPIYLGGFRMAIFSFLDFAIIDDDRVRLLDNELYQGYGLGIRFRNENLAFNTIQIRFAWYPIVPEGILPQQLDFSGNQSLGLEGFRVNRPQVLPFD